MSELVKSKPETLVERVTYLQKLCYKKVIKPEKDESLNEENSLICLAENILKTITESDFNDEAWELKAAYEIAIDKNDYQLAIERFLNYENYMQINPFDENKDSEYINENFEEIVEKYRDLLFFSIDVIISNINSTISTSTAIWNRYNY